MLEVADATLHLLYLVGGVDNLGKRALLTSEVGLLLKVAHGGVACEADRSLVGALLAHDDSEKGRLA